MKKQANVLINGGGPVGLVLANLLGKLGIKTILIEKEMTVFPISICLDCKTEYFCSNPNKSLARKRTFYFN